MAAQNAVDNINALLKQDVRWRRLGLPDLFRSAEHEFSATLESVGKKDQLPRAARVGRQGGRLLVTRQITNRRGPAQAKPGMDLGKIITTTPAHMKRTLRVDSQPRELLQLAGYELVEMKDSDTCCGMGGPIR